MDDIVLLLQRNSLVRRPNIVSISLARVGPKFWHSSCLRHSQYRNEEMVHSNNLGLPSAYVQKSIFINWKYYSIDRKGTQTRHRQSPKEMLPSMPLHYLFHNGLYCMFASRTIYRCSLYLCFYYVKRILRFVERGVILEIERSWRIKDKAWIKKKRQASRQ